VEYMPWWELLYEEPPQVKNGFMKVPAGAGWGLKLSPAALKKYALS
jgi:L-alanine-DL-glutamate epimerase-like enolase superfamily enzyme